MAAGGITIDDDVMVAANAQLISNNHDLYDHQVLTCKPVHLKRNCWIGAGATILPGVTENISQYLQRSNDDLRNRNGLLSRKEQEQLEERIRDIQSQNCKLEKLVVMSSVEAVEVALEKKKEAEQKMRNAEKQERLAKKNVETTVRKIKKQTQKKVAMVKKREEFWKYSFWIMTMVVFASCWFKYFII